MSESKGVVLQKKLEVIRRAAEERDAERRAKSAGYPYVDIRKIPISIDALRVIPEEKARAAELAAIELKVREVAVAVVDPRNPAVRAVVESLEKRKHKAKLFVASRSGVASAWEFYRFVTDTAKEITGKVEITRSSVEQLLAKFKDIYGVKAAFDEMDFRNTTTTRLLETVLAGALTNRASDIHFEAEETQARLRFRLDGVLHDVTDIIPRYNYQALISRIKLLSGLKINVFGEPQDGRFTINLQTKEVEVRVSIIPSEFGETIVMRLLDPDSINVDIRSLGMRDDDLALVEEELKKPNGLILNTGPTGSGKTTTLYAFLKQIVNPEIKIITIEDPIEYRIQGIEQTQVDPSGGYTFEKGLRAIVRQDPDVILVGEIRDLETADIALQASLTGHFVFSTLHTNDAIGAVPRLLNLGVQPIAIAPALNLVIAQRLVRKLCASCRVPVTPSPAAQEALGAFVKKLPARIDKSKYQSFAIYEAKGCGACNALGYKGRAGIFEFFKGGQKFEEIVMKGVSELNLKELSVQQEMVTMQEDGVLKVLSGLTSFEEVEKATGPIGWLPLK